MLSLFAKILCLMPQVFPGPLQYSLAGKALSRGIWSYKLVNIRDFGIGKHKAVDDTQYGGGYGMVIRPDVLGNAIEHSLSTDADIKEIYYFSPRGRKIDNNLVREVISKKKVMLICGKFEGIDERVVQEYNLKEISLGDFILSSGEICAIALLDACIRMLPGVLNKEKSYIEESFSEIEGVEGILENPLYTKPFNWKERKVPAVLLSGNHNEISKWRLKEALKTTLARRPDLIK